MEENGFNEFLLWERATHDTIDFKKAYVDMAGDLVAGLLLSQIIFWFLPDKKGSSKIRVWKDGEWWLAKSYHKWQDEIRITKDQARRAIGILCGKNLIVTERYMFNGAPTMHIRINASVFLDSWKCAVAQYQVGQDTLGSGPQPKSITETTVETTSENTTENKKEIDFLSQNPKPNRERIRDVLIDVLAEGMVPESEYLLRPFEKGVDALVLEFRSIEGKSRLDDDLTSKIIAAIRAAYEDQENWQFDRADTPTTPIIGRIKAEGRKAQKRTAARAEWQEASQRTQEAMADREPERPGDAWWGQVLEALSLQMPKTAFDVYLKNAKLLGHGDDVIRVGVQYQGTLEWIENRLRPIIERTLAEFGVQRVEFEAVEGPSGDVRPLIGKEE